MPETPAPQLGGSYKQSTLAFAVTTLLLTSPSLLLARDHVASAPATCTISASSTKINVGQSVQFSGSVTGRRAKYSWSFQSGAPSTSTNQSVSVAYQTAGTFNAALNGSSSLGKCTATTVINVNSAPVTNGDSYSTDQNQALQVAAPGVLGNDSDPEGHTITASLVSPPSHGSVTLNANGSFTYTPNSGYSGTDSFTYKATDSRGAASAATTVTITVKQAQLNKPPVAQPDNYYTNQGIALQKLAPGVLGNDTDPEGDTLTAQLVSSPANGTLNLASGGGFVYTPNANFSGTDSFSYKANDGTSSSAAAQVTITVYPKVVSSVSINSTSQSSINVPASPVPEQSPANDTGYQLLVNNDLGMHCGDLDTRISSILPPFNVLHAQVISKGTTPRVLTEGEVALSYSAASNPNDPRLGDESMLTKNGGVYKTNFWDIASQAYDPFYPSGILAMFYSANAADNIDLGLPVPDVERFYLGDGYLSATQMAMPGINSPYVQNAPQSFSDEHIGTLPFFTGFDFGYTANLNMFEAAGVPISVFDDAGRENPYPLVRVEANVAGHRVTRDTVMPISGEAECQRCHASTQDGGNGAAIERLGTDAAVSIQDPSKDVPDAASVEWASDINILRLHDLKHSTNLFQGYDSDTGKASNPVVCQTCHYTPALDLAQLGPLGPENDTALDLNGGALHIDSLANGRDQVKHKTMSNVMHGHHASVKDSSGNPLFPDMPPAVDANGNKRSPLLTQELLQQTCYSCHPGRKTSCMRGAMANGGLVCQDCHGNMAQVGKDFSNTVSPSNPGDFKVAHDFYTNQATPRVPWANEPGCGSCHTGNAVSNLAGGSNVLVNPTDSTGNYDGIRLVQAYKVGDSKATPIVPSNKQFAENVVNEGRAADGNPKLYRVSTGHGGLGCEGCHGSTHAEWPNANPMSNDNVEAKQIQGHTGVVAECTACHSASAFEDGGPYKASLKGPHGMHAVSSQWWNTHHKEARSGNNCQTCHGNDGKGTVLSRASADRVFNVECEGGQMCTSRSRVAFPKGYMVGCDDCHSNKINSTGD